MSWSSSVALLALIALGAGCADCEDTDEDGWTTCGGDCDDSAASAYPGAPEVCDGLDNDCDGRVGDDLDEDNDGWTPCGGDCDDQRAGLRCDWVDVAAATTSMCALSAAGGAVCWGTFEAADAGPFESIHGGCCAGLPQTIDRGGRPYFLHGGTPITEVPEAIWILATEGWGGVCYLNEEGGTWCWDGVEFDPGDFGEPYTDLALGQDHWCAIREDTTIHCLGIASPDGDGYIDVESGDNWSCAIRESQRVDCWGPGSASPPAGPFLDFAMGWFHACALDTDARIVCWPNDGTVTTQPPEGQFRALAAGGSNNCAIRLDGTIECWGPRVVTGQLVVPE